MLCAGTKRPCPSSIGVRLPCYSAKEKTGVASTCQLRWQMRFGTLVRVNQRWRSTLPEQNSIWSARRAAHCRGVVCRHIASMSIYESLGQAHDIASDRPSDFIREQVTREAHETFWCR